MITERAPEGWKNTHPAKPVTEEPGYEQTIESEQEVEVHACKRAWARLLAKVNEIDPLMCPKCGTEMKVIAVIKEPEEIKRIPWHLTKIGRSPPGFDAVYNSGAGSTSSQSSIHGQS